MFSPSSLIFLFFLSLTVLGLEDTRENPVDVLQVTHPIIRTYKGPWGIDTLKLFHNIEYLQLRRNNFTIFQWNFLNTIPNLKSLELFNNFMERVDFNITQCCNKLEILELTESGLPEIPDEFLKKIGGIESLKYLTFRDEKMRILRKDTLANPNLGYLTILACHLDTIDDGAFSKLQKLRILDLSYNSIRAINKDTFASLQNVKMINLKGNFLETLTTDMISALPNLETLVLSHNLIMKFDLEGIKTVAPKLRTIDVRGMVLFEPKTGGVELLKDPFAKF
ncbi:leucine-rich repeat-containing protein 4C-like [Coccinella septempunctata]|uniref:leucine-rich repeat-containing protein 4C-like n=1 Tax=Coccinella septempunctata TaxID=41139 RepID=UPI001D0702CA|nr:leucine-rich repeat-containing protein 4C-like [Coccinella septempunctata]